jgi:peptidoglycan hydrolase FlgJ
MSSIQATALKTLTITEPLGKTDASLPTSQKRSVQAAKDFEAAFLSLLLKGMRQTLEPDSLFPGDNSDVQGGLFDDFMGKHLANAGGVGLAATIQRQMQQESPSNVDRNRGTGGNMSRPSGA